MTYSLPSERTRPRAGVLPAKPCQPVEFTSTGCFSIRGPRGMYSAGLDGDIVLFRFNV